jgi:hypothetical protein
MEQKQPPTLLTSEESYNLVSRSTSPFVTSRIDPPLSPPQSRHGPESPITPAKKTPTRQELSRIYTSPTYSSTPPQDKGPIEPLLEAKEPIQPPVSNEIGQSKQFDKAILASEYINIGVASFNYYYTLNADNLVELLASATRIDVTLHGITRRSIIGSAISPLYTLYNHGLIPALAQSALSACFMLLPGNILSMISIAHTAYGLFNLYQTNYGDQYYPSYIQSYKDWTDTAKSLSTTAPSQALREFFEGKAEAYGKEIIKLQNTVKKNEYDECTKLAEAQEAQIIKLGGSIFKANEAKKESFEKCKEILLQMEEIYEPDATASISAPTDEYVDRGLNENPEPKVNGAGWKYKTDL